MATEEEAKIKVKFQNLEMPGVRLDFTLQGVGYGLEHNTEYELPVSVVEHLNALQVPDPYWIVDEETGQLKHYTRMRNRFSCQILDLKELLRQAGVGAAVEVKHVEKVPKEEKSELPFKQAE